MAELASGAVSSLLGMIRNEVALLGGVMGDVQFIKEEMESMNSFLLHLARTVPPTGEHDEQVQTWMSQVRLLAQDCNNCIDLYLYRGNPNIHLAKSGLWRYLLWTPWFLRKMVAQHRAANQLRVLKDRARDVGERRARYGVEVPTKEKAVAGTSLTAPSAAAGDGSEGAEEDGDDKEVATGSHHYGLGKSSALFEPPTRDDYLKRKLVEWMEKAEKASTPRSTASIAIVAPDTEDTGALAHEASTVLLETTQLNKVIFVDIAAVHITYYPLRPSEILYYILWHLGLPAQGQGEGKQLTAKDDRRRKKNILWGRWDLFDEIWGKIKELKVVERIEKIKTRIEEMKDSTKLKLGQKQMMKDLASIEPLGILLLALQLLKLDAAAADPPADKVMKEAMHTLVSYEITKTAKKLREYMERTTDTERTPPIQLHATQYEHILQDVFPPSKPQLQATQDQVTRTMTVTGSTTLGEGQIKELIHKAKLEILQELHEDKSDKKPEKGTQAHDQLFEIPLAVIEEATVKIQSIQWEIRRNLFIKELVEKIRACLKPEKTLITIKSDENYVYGWEETRKALSLLDYVSGVVIVTTSKNTQRAKEYCYPLQEPISYSLVGLYHDSVLQIISKQNNEGNNYNLQVLHDILDECDPYEFCMKIFTHALHAKPKRSEEELRNLHSTLQAVSPKSLGSVAKKMIKFSYNDLTKEYKSCLLYLAIFPPGYKISRSSLVGRWVVEGLITTEDWRWSSSVNKAERCFDTLINRWLVYPADIGATGEVKSCIVGERVHEFITKTAEKQHIVETRLSRHLARHFSISNDLRLRGSDKIEDFLKKLSGSSQVYLLKVLDLEGCRCFGRKNKSYLKDICCKIKLLKYLSLRRTNVMQLPDEINNLHELEVLDIRQTEVPAVSTRNLRLLKLKRLLADRINPDNSSTSLSVDIPEKVENMDGIEVLSSFKPRTSQDLKDIGKLWQLRKLGVVIEDKESHLKSLTEGISDLNECIQSLSITLLPETRREGIPSCGWLLPGTNVAPSSSYKLKFLPKVLESLRISGSTKNKDAQLLPLLLDNGNSQLTKITLSNTSLSPADLMVLSKLPMLRCMKLRCIEYPGNKLTFKKDEFKKLKYFLIEGSTMIEIIFEHGATGELKKIVLPLSDGLKLSGLDELPRLEELELNNNSTSNSINSSRNNNVPAPTAIATATTTGAPTNDATTVPAPTTPAAIAPNTNSTAASATINDITNIAAPIASKVITTNTNSTTAPAANDTTTIAAPIGAAGVALNTNSTDAATHTIDVNMADAAATTTDNTIVAKANTTDMAATTTHTTETTVTAATTSTTDTTAAANASTTDTTAITAHTNATGAASSTTAAANARTTDTTMTAATTSSTTDTSTTTTTTAATTAHTTDTSTTTTPTASTTATATTIDTTANASTIKTNTTATTAHTTDTNATAAGDTSAAAITPATTATTTSTPDPTNSNKILLSLLDNAKKITKVTLRSTMLKQGGLQILAKKPNIRCLVLLEKSYGESQLTFNKEDFPKLNHLIVECSNITTISFNVGSCPKIEKLIWTFTEMSSLTGIHNIRRLKELEFNGEFVSNDVKEEIKKHKNKPHFTHYKPDSKDQAEEKIEEQNAAAKFSCFWRDKGCCQRRN